MPLNKFLTGISKALQIFYKVKIGSLGAVDKLYLESKNLKTFTILVKYNEEDIDEEE